MRKTITTIAKRYYSTPVFHTEFNCKRHFKREKGKENDKKKIIYCKPSYEYMYNSLPIKNYLNERKIN